MLVGGGGGGEVRRLEAAVAARRKWPCLRRVGRGVEAEREEAFRRERKGGRMSCHCWFQCWFGRKGEGRERNGKVQCYSADGRFPSGGERKSLVAVHARTPELYDFAALASTSGSGSGRGSPLPV